MSRKLEVVRQKRKQQQQSALAVEVISENAGLLPERQTTASSSDFQRNSTLCSELRFSETTSTVAPLTPTFSGVPPVPPGTPQLTGGEQQASAKTKTKYQIAKELSDLVVYLQTVKFQGLAGSPQVTVKRKRSIHLHSGSVQHQLAQMSHSSSGQLATLMQRRITPHHSSTMLAVAATVEKPQPPARERAEGDDCLTTQPHPHSSSNASLTRLEQQQLLHRGGHSFNSGVSAPQSSYQPAVQPASSVGGHSNNNSLTAPGSSGSTSQPQPPPPSASFSLRPRNRHTESVLSMSGVWTGARLHAPPICRQVYSLGEAKAKQLCRRFPIGMLLHTEKSMFRAYPSGTRIDSSNFNPLTFWSFGLQMVALNYQTEDVSTFINTAMFESNGNSGYVLKPEVMRNKNHPLFGRFNPFDKDSESLSPIEFAVTIISGQYLWSQTLPTCSSSAAVHQLQRDANLSVVTADVHQSEKRSSTNLSGQPAPLSLSLSNTTSSVAYAATQVTPLVEVELLGIPCDSHKVRTRPFHKNAVNPIWNETFRMSVAFSELAFVRFGVVDTNTGHLIAQRVLPLKCFRPGYRHVQLRSPLNNQTLELASLFVYTTVVELPVITPNRPTVAAPENELLLTSTSLTVPNSSTNSSACFHMGGTPDSGMPIEELQVLVYDVHR